MGRENGLGMIPGMLPNIIKGLQRNLCTTKRFGIGLHLPGARADDDLQLVRALEDVLVREVAAHDERVRVLHRQRSAPERRQRAASPPTKRSGKAPAGGLTANEALRKGASGRPRPRKRLGPSVQHPVESAPGIRRTGDLVRRVPDFQQAVAGWAGQPSLTAAVPASGPGLP
eukprot:gene7887-biopygen12713